MMLSNVLYNAEAQQPDLRNIDFSTINVDELPDSQLRLLIERARSEGMSIQDMEAEAISRGMPYSEVVKLRQRVETLEREDSMPGTQRDSGRSLFERPPPGRSVVQDTLLSEREFDRLTEHDEEIQVFGYDLFKRKNLSFEPSLNIPTPVNYQLGPNDELIIEVWGASQQSYQEIISPEGQIRISNIGPIRVGGLTVDQASELIINRLSTIYSGIRGSNPNTFAQVSLGNIRSIKVTISGNAFMPGTYTLPAFATAFNALYLAGGPSARGSFRDIRVIRQGSSVAEIDLYDFLIRGEITLNVRLQDEDLVFIGPVGNQVTITGEVKRPAIYELKEYETLEDLTIFSGGFSARAYQKRLLVNRKTESQRKLLNVESDLFSSFLMQNGDQIDVGEILERYENRVTIRGAVFREGEYGLTEGMTLKELIYKAEGFREDAFRSRAAIYRLQENLELEVIDVDLTDQAYFNEPDIPLKREDLVIISSVLELREERTVGILGEVREPGTFPFARNITLGEMIRKAGGLNDAASLSRVEVARRIVNKDAVSHGNRISEVFTFPLNAQLSLDDEASAFPLVPFDIVFVRRSPGYQTQILAQVQGEVNFPGSYAITHKTERISDLIQRSGGLTENAYIPGATLIRRIERSQTERLQRLSALDASNIELDVEELVAASEQSIGINLEVILRNPRGINDLILEEGDILRIPQELQTVRLNGALLYPVTTRYQERTRVPGYISQAGGFATNASKRNVFVVYANGSVDKTRNYVLFRSYPPIEPGAEIIVPAKPVRPSRTLQETISISSAVTSLALVLVTLISRL
jgi:protein involved in polysaccharide export with SLBB domain